MRVCASVVSGLSVWRVCIRTLKRTPTHIPVDDRYSDYYDRDRKPALCPSLSHFAHGTPSTLTPKRCTLTHQHACIRGLLKHARAHPPNYPEEQEQPSWPVLSHCTLTQCGNQSHGRIHPPTHRTFTFTFTLWSVLGTTPNTKPIQITPRASPHAHAYAFANTLTN